MADDVVIVGGGPAASAAAIVCARAGLGTTVVAGPALRRDHADDEPVESLHPGAVSLLEKLEAMEALDASALGVYRAIRVGAAERRLSAVPHEEWEGVHVNRRLFDASLLNVAVAAGALAHRDDAVLELDVESAVARKVTTAGGMSFSARWFVDASGSRRVLARAMGLEQRFLSPPLTAWTGTEQSRDSNAFSEFAPATDGWTWRTASVEGRSTWTRVARSRPAVQRESRFDAAWRVADVRWRISRPIVSGNVLLAGDAAGRLDPAYGQGVLTALFSGLMTGRAIVASHHAPSRSEWHLAAYDQWFVERFEANAAALRQSYDRLGIDILDSSLA